MKGFVFHSFEIFKGHRTLDSCTASGFVRKTYDVKEPFYLGEKKEALTNINEPNVTIVVTNVTNYSLVAVKYRNFTIYTLKYIEYVPIYYKKFKFQLHVL